METTTAEAVDRGTIPDITFGSLYREHHPHVLSYFLRRFDRDTAIDCAAEVFTTAWRRRDDVPGGEDTIRWLYGVCRNVGRNQDRSLRRRSRLRARLAGQQAARPAEPDAEVVRLSDEELVTLAMSRLKYEDREVLYLATWEELPRGDIALILGCSRHAVDQRIQRAHERLRREFAKISRMQGARP